METMKERYKKAVQRCKRSLTHVDENLKKRLNDEPNQFEEILYENAHESLKCLVLASFGEDAYMEVAENVVDFIEGID